MTVSANYYGAGSIEADVEALRILRTAAIECPSCGVQLNPDGSVDNLPDEPAEHYGDCAAPVASDK